MLSYQHAYHAGNFADIHKHAVLVRLLAALQRKDKPFCYLETHAGRGRYDLRSGEAQKTAEFKAGIGQLWGQSPAPLLEPLFDVVKGLNADGKLRTYPGSPLIARASLRPQDRMQLMELHPGEFEALKEVFRRDRQVSLHQRDGFEGVLALSPPAEKRGLVLVDPSYELKEDYQQVPRWAAKLFQRWSSATLAIWYPLLPAGRHQVLLKGLERSGLRKILVSEFPVAPIGGEGMYGSGMAVVNTPWQLDEELAQCLPGLAQHLAGPGADAPRLTWLVGE